MKNEIRFPCAIEILQNSDTEMRVPLLQTHSSPIVPSDPLLFRESIPTRRLFFSIPKITPTLPFFRGTLESFSRGMIERRGRLLLECGLLAGDWPLRIHLPRRDRMAWLAKEVRAHDVTSLVFLRSESMGHTQKRGRCPKGEAP
ncbi:hypothetical protein AVEN_76457-1 [Araneus ventricosus]|uniref:Uncharacterized protein n=1 Tax=Araneus ventricosus TaxID=182803 RepID=A0A4Y2VEA0_ARAVE|nr:hypothetical protein AVEN_76457-1 [Araneus ventricosus]